MSMSAPGHENGRPAAEVVAEGAERLSAAGVEQARTEAERIVRHAAGLTLEFLIAHPDTVLSPAQTSAAEALMARRQAREPLPYLLGEVEFYSLAFHISPSAIVPRPETEILVEAAAERARQTGAALAAEVGTGSGAAAVALAREAPALRVVATDISLEALRLAQANVCRHGVESRVALVCCDLLEAVGRPVDCVVANLPYIARDEFEGLEPEVRDWEPRLALDGGMDGLGMIARLSARVGDHLNKGGFAALEVGAGQAGEAAKLLTRGGLGDIEVLSDYAGIERVVIGWRRG